MATTITVDDSTLERFKELKRELDDKQDAPDHTNESFLQALMDTWEAGDSGFYGEEFIESLKNEISMANEPSVEVDTENILKRIDDLESRLPRKVAEELQR